LIDDSLKDRGRKIIRTVLYGIIITAVVPNNNILLYKQFAQVNLVVGLG